MTTSSTAAPQGALSHLKVLDLSRVLAGPWCTQMLADYGARFSKIKTAAPSTRTVLPGTTLLREFDGKKYKVTVLADGGYEYDGHQYKSLSAIAKLITGTQWSGPAFFGLKGKKA